jgi:hypothetical protein
MRLDEYGKAHVALRNGSLVIGRFVLERFKRKFRVRGLFVFLMRRLPLIKRVRRAYFR